MYKCYIEDDLAVLVSDMIRWIAE